MKVIRNHSCVSVIIVFATGAYEQIEGAAMGSSPLWALASQHIYAVYWREIKLEKLDLEGKLPPYYRRYVDDTLTVMPDLSTARDFLHTLNHTHPTIKSIMKVEKDGMPPFLDIQLLNQAPHIETKVFANPTNSGVLLHYHSNVNNRYKREVMKWCISLQVWPS